jgi:hypothetical protein
VLVPRRDPHRTRATVGRPSLWIALGLVLLVWVGGWALASVTLTPASQTASGQYASYAGSVTGVTDVATYYTTVPSPAPTQASTTHTVLTSLTMGSSFASQVDNYCANACTASVFAEEMQFDVSAPSGSAAGMSIAVTAGAGSSSVTTTVYFQIPKSTGGATSATLNLYVDLGASASSVSVKVTLAQCANGNTC